jgi:hypothetical protein
MKKEKNAEFEVKVHNGNGWVRVKAATDGKMLAVLLMVSDGKEQVSIKPTEHELNALKNQLEELLHFMGDD